MYSYEISEDDMIESDAEDLSFIERLVLLIVGDAPISKTRLQKISLIYDELYKENESTSHNPYFFGGYSDSVDESADNLLDIGILDETGGKYRVSDYGKKVIGYLSKGDECFSQVREKVRKIVDALSEVSDRNVIGLTYHYYSKSAVNSTIKTSVERLNSNSYFDGRPLAEVNRAEFEERLRKGEKISMTQKVV